MKNDQVRQAIRKVKFDELVKEKLTKHGPWFEFDGWNCHDFENDCLGWDGQDRRCQCGNRRVYWEMNDEATEIWAVAW